MSKTLVSVIVPVYNTAHYLRTCLDSIIHQSYKHIEIICINDGSTDDSLNILNSYNDKRISVITTSNRGLGAARNYGLGLARGRYIMFVDSDDSLAPTAIEELYGAINSAHDIDMAASCIKTTYSTPGTRELFERGDKTVYNCLRFHGLQDVSYETISGTGVSVCNKIWKRDIIKRCDLRFPEDAWFEDNYFYYRYMIHARKAFYLDGHELYLRLRREGSITHQAAVKNPRAIDLLRTAWLAYHDSRDSRDFDEWRELLGDNITRSYQEALLLVPELYIDELNTLYADIRLNLVASDSEEYVAQAPFPQQA